MSTVNQQTLAESGASDRPLILEKGSYTPWASWFLRFLENKKEDGELLRDSIFKGAYKRKGIPDSDNESKTISKPISKISKPDKEQYFANFRVMNYILQGIPNNIYNSFKPHVNAFKAKKAARNHDPLALVTNSHAHSSNSHASSTYSCSSQPYYVTHPSSVIDNDDDYQREIQGDA
ncbi:hypothetical protein Tco_0039712 [Tanacetum coccineum]